MLQLRPALPAQSRGDLLPVDRLGGELPRAAIAI